MKKIFTLILAIILVGTLLTGCSQDENEVLINTTVKDFRSYEALKEYAENLDTEKYQIIGEYKDAFRTNAYQLIFIQKAANENYEVFEFSSNEARQEFRKNIDSNKKVSYYKSPEFFYLIVVTKNTAKKSTITAKDILQNDENYIVIADDDNLVMIPKNICEFITSDDSNIVYLETTAGTITKATFYITEEMKNKIQ